MFLKKSCPICFEDGFKAEQMFSTASCGHRFCVKCVKRYIEVRLSEGSVLRCPHYQCKSKLDFRSCANILTPKLRAMWEQRIKEDSIPITDRIYCPNPRCSVLMSKTKLFIDHGARSCCVKCGEPFCINCKVPWHTNLLCNDYKRLNTPSDDRKLKTLANLSKWRQCGNCQHMIGRSGGCITVTCRCGYKFCYTCGAQWKFGGCPHKEDFDMAIYTFSFVIVAIPIICIAFNLYGK